MKKIKTEKIFSRALRVPYDSTNCIRFNGYVLSSATLPGHPTRNTVFLAAGPPKSKKLNDRIHQNSVFWIRDALFN
jgi:hypothetical protein